MTPSPALLAQLGSDSVGVGIGAGLLLLFGFAILLSIALFAFWVWMLVDCAQAPEPPGDANHRLVWVLILVFAGWIGAILYFFLVRQRRLAAERARSFTSPPIPGAPRLRS